MRVVTDYWINPLTGSHVMPTDPGDIIEAAVSYWEDVVMEARDRRVCKSFPRAEKDAIVEKAFKRLTRFRAERARRALRPKSANKLTLALATGDLEEVMKVAA